MSSVNEFTMRYYYETDTGLTVMRDESDTNPVPESALEYPSFDRIYLDLAAQLAKRSACKRLQVGVVITSVDHRYVYGIGYNGGASGVSETHAYNRCSGQAGSCGCLHGEENAIINCCAPRSVEKIVYSTHTPCAVCAKRLINMGGVKRVVCSAEYRDTAATKWFFDQAKIELVIK